MTIVTTRPRKRPAKLAQAAEIKVPRIVQHTPRGRAWKLPEPDPEPRRGLSRSFGLGVLFFGAAVSLDALAYGPGDNRSPAVKLLVSCLEKAYSEGAYLSTDGGRAAKRLLSTDRRTQDVDARHRA